MRAVDNLTLLVTGTTEEISDRKWINGEVINKKRKYTDAEMKYMEEFDLQLKR